MKLTPKQKKQIQKIGDKYNFKLMVIHGSFATGKEKPDSDLDIAILGKNSIDFDAFMKISDDLEETFDNSSDRELDVKILENADALFLYQVMKNSILIYGSSFDYWQLKTYAIRNYWDHKPIFKLEELLNKKYFSKKYA